MVSALVSESSGPCSSPGQGHYVVFLGKTLDSPAVPLSTQVYKWVLANLKLGVFLRWTSIPSRGLEVLLVTSYYRNRDKRRPDGPLGSYAVLAYLTRLTNQVVIRVMQVQILTCIALLAAEFWLTVLSLAWHDDLYKVSNVYIGDTKAKRVSTGEKVFLSQSN